MAFPAGKVPTEGFATAQRLARNIHSLTLNYRDQSAAGPMVRSAIVAHMGALTRAIDDLNAVAAIPGIVQYARDQVGNQSADIAGEFTSMVNTATALRDWINSNIPTSGGAWLVASFDLYGQPVNLTFTSAQLETYRTNCDTFLATIEVS